MRALIVGLRKFVGPPQHLVDMTSLETTGVVSEHQQVWRACSIDNRIGSSSSAKMSYSTNPSGHASTP